MTSKIVDNTFISACIGEINCINLLDITSEHYDIITTNAVFEETKNGFDIKRVTEVYETISVSSKYPKLYFKLKKWLETRYPALHDGEISTFLLALLNFAISDSAYYYITDDKSMKNVIRNLNNDEMFFKILGRSIDMDKFKVTGTIGFTRRLIEKGVISTEYIDTLLDDMENNGFYLSKEVKDHLRGI